MFLIFGEENGEDDDTVRYQASSHHVWRFDVSGMYLIELMNWTGYFRPFYI